MPLLSGKLRAVLVIGIDENGLGPILGPLVVTAVAFEAADYSPEAFWRAAGTDLTADDSKKVFSPGRLGPAEAATLSWLRAFGLRPPSFADLADAVVVPPPLRRPCHLMPAYCAPSGTPLPVWASPKHMSSFDGEEQLAKAGITPFAIRAFSICPGVYNTATDAGGINKFALDCRLMLTLIKQLSAAYDGEVLALCGKVGATRRYGPWLENAGILLWSAEEETRDISTYRIMPYGRISFIRDGDASHLPIAVASMVGKYLRELAMRDINTLLAPPESRPASGYRDTVTARFIEETEARREAIGIEPFCFTRNS